MLEVGDKSVHVFKFLTFYWLHKTWNEVLCEQEVSNCPGLKNLQAKKPNNGWKQKILLEFVSWGWFRDTCAAPDPRKHGNHLQFVLLIYMERL